MFYKVFGWLEFVGAPYELKYGGDILYSIMKHPLSTTPIKTSTRQSRRMEVTYSTAL